MITHAQDAATVAAAAPLIQRSARLIWGAEMPLRALAGRFISRP